MSALRRQIRSARRFAGRAAHAYDLWYRLGYTPGQAWRIAGRWQ